MKQTNLDRVSYYNGKLGEFHQFVTNNDGFLLKNIIKTKDGYTATIRIPIGRGPETATNLVVSRFNGDEVLDKAVSEILDVPLNKLGALKNLNVVHCSETFIVHSYDSAKNVLAKFEDAEANIKNKKELAEQIEKKATDILSDVG